MSIAKFTPGPWEIEHPMGDDTYSIVPAGKQTYEWVFIAQVSDSEDEEKHDDYPIITRTEARANARLIAAAPELLEACEAVIIAVEGSMKYTGVEMGQTLIATITNAIAKARGGVTR